MGAFRTSVSNEETNVPHTGHRRKANCIGHILRRNYLLKHVIEGKIAGRIEVMERRGRRRKQLLGDTEENERVLEIERGSTRSHSVENSPWKRIWTCSRTECGIMTKIMIVTRFTDSH